MLPLPASPPTLNVVIAPLLVLKSKPLLALTVTVLLGTALALFNKTAPARIVMPPEQVFVPSSCNVPGPLIVKDRLPPVSWTMPEMSSTAPAEGVTVRLPARISGAEMT